MTEKAGEEGNRVQSRKTRSQNPRIMLLDAFGTRLVMTGRNCELEAMAQSKVGNYGGMVMFDTVAQMFQ